MSEQLTIGFGDGAVHGMARSGAGGVLHSAGATQQLADVRIERGERSWHAQAGDAFDVELEPLGEPAVFAGSRQEWLCRVRGSASGAPLECLGHCVSERGGAGTAAGLREIAIWFGEDLGFVLRAVRPRADRAHDHDAVAAFALRGAPPQPTAIAEPLLSTVYDGDGHQRQAGLELWETEEFPLRVAGEALGGGELAAPGGARLWTAFFRWRHDGREGAGRYDLTVPAA
jgi:hypothetical protein